MADKDLAKQDEKARDALKDVGGPKTETARTKDITPSVEKPGEKPTRPDRS